MGGFEGIPGLDPLPRQSDQSNRPQNIDRASLGYIKLDRLPRQINNAL
jgi:hypothetical protein